VTSQGAPRAGIERRFSLQDNAPRAVGCAGTVVETRAGQHRKTPHPKEIAMYRFACRTAALTVTTLSALALGAPPRSPRTPLPLLARGR